MLCREMEHSSSRSCDDTSSPRLVLGEWIPWVDILETKDKLFIKAELPGLEAKDINVSISGDILTTCFSHIPHFLGSRRLRFALVAIYLYRR